MEPGHALSHPHTCSDRHHWALEWAPPVCHLRGDLAHPIVAQGCWTTLSPQGHDHYLGPGSHLGLTWICSSHPCLALPHPLAGPSSRQGGILGLTSILSTQGGGQEDGPEHLGKQEGERQDQHGQQDREAGLRGPVSSSLVLGTVPGERKATGSEVSRAAGWPGAGRGPELLPDHCAWMPELPPCLSRTFSVPGVKSLGHIRGNRENGLGKYFRHYIGRSPG